MKRFAKKMTAVCLLLAAVVLSTMAVSCKSSEKTMYGRKMSNKPQTIKSNIKVKGSNKANSTNTKAY